MCVYLCAHTLVHALVWVCHGALAVFLTVLILANVCGACLAPRVLALRSRAGLQACQTRICVHAPGLLWCEAAAERTLDAVRERVCTCPCLLPCSMLPSYVSPGFSSSSSPTGAGVYFMAPCTADTGQGMAGVRLQTDVRASFSALLARSPLFRLAHQARSFPALPDNGSVARAAGRLRCVPHRTPTWPCGRPSSSYWPPAVPRGSQTCIRGTSIGKLSYGSCVGSRRPALAGPDGVALHVTWLTG